MTDASRPVVLVGLIRLRDHCAFTWEEPERGGRRTARVMPTHCAACVQELVNLGYRVVRQETEPNGPAPRA
jgi:hypothetical protein